MNRNELCKKYGFIDCTKQMTEMSESDIGRGYIKFNIPNPNTPENLNGEGVWGWVDEDGREKYNDDSYYGKLEVILCNDPINYSDVLTHWIKVVIRCNGPKRPTLDTDWIRTVLSMGEKTDTNLAAANVNAKTVVECCPHCDNEIEMRWNVESLGYKAFCPICGNRLMLCDECQHRNNGEYTGDCDYDTTSDSCRFNADHR